MVDVATGWTECLPLIARDGGLVVEAIKRAQSLFPLAPAGSDFDNDSTFMNDVVVPWCHAQNIEVTRSRAYKKNDQAFVEQKNGAVVRRDLQRRVGAQCVDVVAVLIASRDHEHARRASPRSCAERVWDRVHRASER